MLSLRCMRWVGWLLLLPVVVACSNGRGSVEDQPPPAQGAQDSFTVGGTVSGLVGSGLVLQNNGRFTFPTRLPGGAGYNVTIARQPLLDHCEVRRGSGTIHDRDIDNVEVRCDR